jgi:copper oxidase (laccase) domain-containing protein
MIQFKYLNDDKITHFFGDKSDRNMSSKFGEKEIVKSNIVSFIKPKISESTSVFGISIEYKDKIVEIPTDSQLENKLEIVKFSIINYIDCDCLITKRRDVAIFIAVGDCIPMILTDKNRSFIALTHLSWMNTDLVLPTKVINYIVNNYKIQTNEIEILIGPAIRKDSYIHPKFMPTNPKVWESYVRAGDDNYVHIDNVGAAVNQLIKCGIKKSNIFDTEIDTFSNSNFFSHQEDSRKGIPDTGRNGVLAMLK